MFRELATVVVRTGGGWSPPRIAGSFATCWRIALRRLQVNAKPFGSQR
jgi:hypothetical protein